MGSMRTVVLRDVGISLAFPEGWSVANPTAVFDRGVFERSDARGSRHLLVAGNLIADAEEPSDEVRPRPVAQVPFFFISDLSATPASSGDVTAVLAEQVAELREGGAEGVVSETIALGIGDVGHVAARIMRDHLDLDTYLFRGDDDCFALTIFSDPAPADRWLSVAATFEFLRVDE